MIRAAKERFREQYGAEWLQEIVGYSNVPIEIPSDEYRPTPWSNRPLRASLEKRGQSITNNGHVEATISMA